jgi:exodeoxyribonuclease VII large subunit
MPERQVSIPAAPDSREIFTPSHLNRAARRLLESGFPGGVWVEGEISNLSRPGSGHWYFSLKDAAAQLRCAMFRQRNLLLTFAPRDGQHVVARGRLSLYEPRGDYQLIVDHLEEAGEGALRRQFEILKTRLAAEGLFAQERKRRLPDLPRRIGIVTSPTGAAVRDILHVLARRFPAAPVLIYPVPVQGIDAAREIAAALALASRRRDCDVLILARGGGSLEDLWPFNEENVARAIRACEIPVITGVGHEVDFTIADFAADVRAPTPSAAAELVVPDCQEWGRALGAVLRRLASALERRLAQVRQIQTWAGRRLWQLHPGVALRQRAQKLDDLEQRLARAVGRGMSRQATRIESGAARLARCSPAAHLADLKGRRHALTLRLMAQMRSGLVDRRGRIAAVARTLQAVSPLATLDRGYAIVSDGSGTVLTRAADTRIGDRIVARLSQGRVQARVEAIEEDDSARSVPEDPA